MSFDDATRSEIRARSQGNCEARLFGCHGQAAHPHHRKLRRHGDDTAVNGLDVCNSCHTRIHSSQRPCPDDERWTMYDLGLLVHHTDDPAAIPIRSCWSMFGGAITGSTREERPVES
jgi:hypothetical protein